MIINFTIGGNGGGASDPSKLDVTVFNEYAANQTIIDESQNEALDSLSKHVDDIELFKYPNATIIGLPNIQSGQVSDFSTVSYLQFPTILDLHGSPFTIEFCFTTATNVQTQQNILDSKFGIALAIKDGKGLMAISSDGQSWNIGSKTGTMSIESNTTYYAKLAWNGIQYKTYLSTNNKDFVEDIVLVGTTRPHPTTIFIGGCDILETGHTPHPFLGTINLNKAYLKIGEDVVWQGMDDAGLATRLATDMNNIDDAGVEKIKEIAKETVEDFRPLIIHSIANTTAGGYQVPQLTADDITNAYNSVIVGKGVIVTDKDDTMHAFVNQADTLNNEISIGILYYSYALLTYTLSADTVSITVKNIS